MRVLGLVLLSSTTAFGVTIGETYNDVIAEKGQPAGSVFAGSTQVLSYPGESIKLRDGVVVDLRATVPAAVTTTRQAPAPVAAVAKPGSAPVDESYAGSATWETDYSQALSQAQAKGCKILILFTGSDWCPWCKKMDADVYSKDEFARFTHDRWVLLKLDFIRHRKLPPEVAAMHQEMQKKYNVKGFPTAIIADSSGKELGKLVGYQNGGVGRFIDSLRSME